MLARLASQREDWQTVIALLDNNIDTDVASEELYLLVSAFVNENPTRRRAITFFDELDPSIVRFRSIKLPTDFCRANEVS